MGPWGGMGGGRGGAWAKIIGKLEFPKENWKSLEIIGNNWNFLSEIGHFAITNGLCPSSSIQARFH